MPGPSQNPKDQVSNSTKRHRTQLRGCVIGRQKTQGNFSRRVIKTGPSGSSTTAQSGTFSTPANAETLVGMASFNMEPGGALYRTPQPPGRGIRCQLYTCWRRCCSGSGLSRHRLPTCSQRHRRNLLTSCRCRRGSHRGRTPSRSLQTSRCQAPVGRSCATYP